MTVSMILFWGAVIFGIMALVRYFGRSGQLAAAPPQSAESAPSPERLPAAPGGPARRGPARQWPGAAARRDEHAMTNARCPAVSASCAIPPGP